MKRFTAILCLFCLLGSMMLPARAEDDQTAPCTVTQGCALPAGHEGNCSVPCATPGCTREQGHEGNCTVPCTATEGCTLTAGHEGDCVVSSQAAPGNEESGFYLSILDNNGEKRLTEISGEICARICFNGQPLKKEELASFDGVSIEAQEGNEFSFRISPNPGGVITYQYNENTYTIKVNSGSQSGPAFYYAAGGSSGNALQLNVGEPFSCRLYCQGEVLTALEGLNYEKENLEISVADDGTFTIKLLKPGDNLIQYGNYSIRVYSNSGSGSGGPAQSIPNVGKDNGLYFCINENGSPLFLNEVNVENAFSCALYVVRKNTATLIPDGKNVTVSPESGLKYGFINGFLSLEKQKAGRYTVSCTVDGATYTATVNVTEQKKMYAQINGEGALLSSLTVTEGEPLKVKFCYKDESGGTVQIVGKVNSNDDCIQIVYDPQTQFYTLTASGTGETKFAFYIKENITTYLLPIIRQEAPYLAVDAGHCLQYDLVLDAGQEIPVEFYFGTKSSMQPYSGTVTCSEGLTLTKKENKTFLSADAEGEYTASVTENEKTYSVPVRVMPALSGGSLFALTGGSGTPQFSTAILCGNTVNLRLCYGSYGTFDTLAAGKLTVSGNSVQVKDDGTGGLTLTGIQAGQTLLQYTDGNRITHNYAIKCYRDASEALFARYSPFATDATVTLSYGGNDLSVGFAYHTADTMYMWPGSSVYKDAKDDDGLDDALCLGAMKAQGSSAVGELADPDFYHSLSNVNISVLSGTASRNLQLGQRESVSWQGVQLSQVSTHAEPGAYFDVQLLLTFDVQLDGKTCRFYRIAPFSYKAEPHDDVTVDIRDADVLNTLLSSSEVLINYLQDNVENYRYSGGSITLNLPAVTYDKIIVSQIMLTGSEDYMATLTLKGIQGTTMPGLFSKGFLTYVDGIAFVSNGKTMPNGKSCGIMVDNNGAAYQPDFDLETLKKYHPDFWGLTNAQAQAKFQTYAPGVPTNGNAFNIGSVNNCSFSGFDYAMYSQDRGIVNSGSGNTVTNCGYGYYLDCTAKQSFAWELNFRDNTFRDIQNTAVYLGTLPSDLDPYYIRFQDNKFYGTAKDFYVTSPGSYYFQRNYYDNGGTHRAAKVTEANGGEIYTCPCRSQANSTNRLWIYADQRTAIFQSEASEMTVDPACIKLLTHSITVPVLDEKRNIVAEWVITKEEGNAQ